MTNLLRTRLCPKCFRLTWRRHGACSICVKGAVTRD